MKRRLTLLVALGLTLASTPLCLDLAGTTRAEAADASKPGIKWQLVAHEGFDDDLHINDVPWTRDPMGPNSPWHVDQFDDDGEAFKAMSNPDYDTQLATLNVFRKRVPFGKDNWLTAEIASIDKDKDGKPDSEPGLTAEKLPNGERVGVINEPSFDAGVLIRPTKPLPPRYRVEMTLRGLDFGGTRNGTFEYDGKTNGYKDTGCKTGYPFTFKGSLPGKTRCDYTTVTDENGFYYMTILDHANPAPHGNPGIHYRRKVIMDGYYSRAPWSRTSAVCNPKTGQMYSAFDASFNGVNAIFVQGNKFGRNNNISQQYFYRTACGDWSGDKPLGPEGKYKDILTSAELRPELLPDAKYTFAVERDDTGYSIEMSGPFRYIGQTTLRFHHDFVEDGRPIWHYNQTPGEYDGRYDQSVTHTGANGSYTTEHTWPAGSAYPDSFVIGDPHINYYEGSAKVDNIRLYVPKS